MNGNGNNGNFRSADEPLTLALAAEPAAPLLLLDGGYASWANTLLGYHSRLHSDTEQVRLSLFAMPRGMGTLSDAVLYENGVLLVEATDELHALLGCLWEWGIQGRIAGAKSL